MIIRVTIWVVGVLNLHTKSPRLRPQALHLQIVETSGPLRSRTADGLEVSLECPGSVEAEKYYR